MSKPIQTDVSFNGTNEKSNVFVEPIFGSNHEDSETVKVYIFSHLLAKDFYVFCIRWSRRSAASCAAFHGVASTAHSAYQSSYK